jgi:hypothetical protein
MNSNLCQKDEFKEDLKKRLENANNGEEQKLLDELKGIE